MIFDLRNPVPNSRPNFHEVLNKLLEDQQKTLNVPVEDASTHKQAALIGGPLSAGENMYKTLQHSYLNSRFSIADGEILYEAIDQYQPTGASLEAVDSPATKSAHVSLEQLLQTDPPPLPPRPGEEQEEIYDDISAPIQHSAHSSNEQLLPKDPALLPSADDEIYDDIAGVADEYQQALSYEVPGDIHQTTSKPPVPYGPRPPLDELYEAPDDMDYEEI